MNRTSSNFTKGIIPGIVSAMGWSMTGIFIKLLPDFSPWLLVSLRSAVALLATVVFLVLTRKSNLAKVFRSGYNWWFAALMVGYYVTAVAAYQLTTVSEVALLLNTSPIFALLIKVYRGGRIGRFEGIGTLVALAGLSVIVLPDILSNTDMNNGRILGAVLALASSYFITIYATQMDRARGKGVQIDVSGVTILTYVFGAFALLLVSFYFDATNPFEQDYTLLNLCFIFGLGLISTVIPSVAYSLAASRISAVKLTTLRLLIPVCASVFAFFFLHEIPNIWVLPGGLLILLGIIILLKQKHYD